MRLALLVLLAALACGTPAVAAPGDDIGATVRVVNQVTGSYSKDLRHLAKGDNVRQDELIDASARVVGLYHDGAQVGFARAVDCDAAGFVYLADVYVLDGHRGHGLGIELVREIVERGPYACRRWILHTRDAHSLYAKLGFGPNERLIERAAPTPPE